MTTVLTITIFKVDLFENDKQLQTSEERAAQKAFRTTGDIYPSDLAYTEVCLQAESLYLSNHFPTFSISAKSD